MQRFQQSEVTKDLRGAGSAGRKNSNSESAAGGHEAGALAVKRKVLMESETTSPVGEGAQHPEETARRWTREERIRGKITDEYQHSVF